MEQKNKNLPAFPFSFKNQFGQEIIFGGLTKQEIVAMEICKSIFTANIDWLESPEDRDYAIKQAYNFAEQFCQHIEQQDK